MVLDDLHGKRHLPGELPLASLGPAHNPGAAAATPPTHTAAQAGSGAPWGRGGRGLGGRGNTTCVGGKYYHLETKLILKWICKCCEFEPPAQSMSAVTPPIFVISVLMH